MARTRDDKRETQGHIPFPYQPGPDRGGLGREPHEHQRDRAPQTGYNLTDSALQTLADIGTFRSLKLDDLATYRHAEDRAQANAEVRNLVRQGLLRVRTMHPSKAVYAALTRDGHSLLNLRRPAGSRQVYYAQFVKPRELRHDAAIFQVTLAREAPAAQVYRPEDFSVRSEDPERAPSASTAASRQAAGEQSQSERDWSYAIRKLQAGDDPQKIIREMGNYRSQDRSDRAGNPVPAKARPHYYAEHTVKKAMVHLGMKPPDPPAAREADVQPNR